MLLPGCYTMPYRTIVRLLYPNYNYYYINFTPRIRDVPLRFACEMTFGSCPLFTLLPTHELKILRKESMKYIANTTANRLILSELSERFRGEPEKLQLMTRTVCLYTYPRRQCGSTVNLN